MTNIFLIQTNDRLLEVDFYRMLYDLPLEKQEKILKKIRKQDRITTLATHYMLQYVLENHYNIPKDKQIFCTGEYGKPYLKNHPTTFFNISHSRTWGVVAVSDDEVGVDIEEYRDFNIDDFSSVLSIDEFTFIKNTCNDNAAACFFNIWTLKESFFKAIGSGMFSEFNTICTTNPKDSTHLSPQLKTQIGPYNLFNIFFNNSIYSSVCSLDNSYPKISTPITIQSLFQLY